ncbi:hypothetical protein G9F31_01480 [Acinetobacter sp. 187]|uniref:hypothetical protein n=1 Tax=Acinetobacter lanii TaxID=2715163 RepID=UPI0014083D5B|nr:hypothetical protein [Acinetobacter lanii]NHC02455.1 hypothetical protein [Acinetobacter lanii]
MNNKITFFILCLTLSFSACQKSNDSTEPIPKSENRNNNLSATKHQSTAIDTKLDCNNTTLDQWYGFDESQLNNAKCLQFKKLNITQMKCEKEANAFGTDFDGIRFESKDKRIFAYPSKQLCETAKGIWESNAP